MWKLYRQRLTEKFTYVIPSNCKMREERVKDDGDMSTSVRFLHVIIINDQFEASMKHGDVVVGRVWNQHETMQVLTRRRGTHYIGVGTIVCSVHAYINIDLKFPKV